MAICSSLLALLIPLAFIEIDLAIASVKFVGKRYMLAVILFFLYFLVKALSPLNWKTFVKLLSCHLLAITVVTLCTLYLHLHFDQKFSILFDEYALSSTAMSMHFDQAVYVQTASLVDKNETLRNIGFVDKRPILFPFLISTVHLIFGFHPENVFWLNSFLTFLLLCLLYSTVCQICDKRSGIFAILLITTLPLLAQNSTGGGFEVLNLCLISTLLLCGFNYMKQSGTGGLDLLIIVSVLLANCRYESILYAVVPAVLFILKGIKERAFKLTWFSVFSPLLLIPPLLSYSILQADDRFKQTNGAAMFSSSHLCDNLIAASTYLFDWGNRYSNSILLSIFGCLAVTCFVVKFIFCFRNYCRTVDYTAVLSSVGLVLIFNTILALNYFWGEWTDPRVARFSLPLQLLFSTAIPLSIRHIFNLKTIPLWMFSGVLIFTACITSPKSRYINDNSGLLLAPACEWSINWINDKAKDSNNYILSDASVGFILYGYPALSIESANSMFEYIQFVYESDFYDNILFVEGFWYNDDFNRIHVPGFTGIAEHFITESLDQYTINNHSFFRISRLVRLEKPKEAHYEEIRGFRRN